MAKPFIYSLLIATIYSLFKLLLPNTIYADLPTCRDSGQCGADTEICVGASQTSEGVCEETGIVGLCGGDYDCPGGYCLDRRCHSYDEPPTSNICDNCGIFTYGMWYTSDPVVTSNSVKINWDGDWGGLNGACVNGNYYHFVVYIGTDYDQVNNNCQKYNGNAAPYWFPAVGDFKYRGNGGALPFGCFYSKTLPQTARSFDSSTSIPNVALKALTTYYLKLTLRLDRDWSTDSSVHTVCKSINTIPFQSQCAVAPVPPANGQIPINQTIQFTTSAYSSQTIAMPTPDVGSVSWVPPVCNRGDGEGGCLSWTDGDFYVCGLHLGLPASSFAPTGSAGDKPHIEIKRQNNTVLFDGTATQFSYLNVNKSNDSSCLDFRFDYNHTSWPWEWGSYNPYLVNANKVRIYYPSPGGLTISDKVDHVLYSQSNPTPPPTIISIPSPSQSTAPYTVNVTGNTAGSANLKASVYAKNGAGTYKSTQCTTPVSVTGGSPPSSVGWWQVKDSDVGTNGSLVSIIPNSQYFGDVGLGGFPGVPAFGDAISGITGGNNGNVSRDIKWLAKSLTNVPRYDYQAVISRIPSDTPIKTVLGESDLTGGTADSNGYTWYKFSGPSDLTISSAQDFGTNKVILLVENANLNIGANITVSPGGFFMAVVGAGETSGGNINVAYTVTDLQGLYLADNVFSTGDNGGAVTPQLHVRGSVAAYGGVNMTPGRNLGTAANNTTPSELFEYAPDQIMLFPKVLGMRKINWKEVAP